jgi:hypothetical protein
MRRLGRASLTILIAAFAVVGLGRVRSTPTGPPARPPLLRADNLDFGDAWEDPRFGWVVPLTNPGSRPVRVDDVRASCGVAVADAGPFTLAPGQTRPLRLTLDLTPKPAEAADRPREFAAELALATRPDPDGPPGREAVPVRGRVRPVLDVRPRDPAFPTRSERAGPPSATFAVVPAVPLETLTAVADTPGFVTTLRQNGPGGSLVVIVTATAPRPVGPFAAEVRLIPVRANGEPLPERVVTVRGRVVPDVAADPPRVTVGCRAVGEEAEEVVAVSSLTGRVVAVESVTAAGDGLTAELLPADGGGPRVRARQRVARAGALNGRVELVVRPEGGGPVSLSVPVVGYGTAPAVGEGQR